MIKKSVFEQELVDGMMRELSDKDKSEGIQDLSKAAEYMHSAIEIFDEIGLSAEADQILNIMSKIASDEQEAKDRHSNGLTSDKMTKNLKDHGTVFNLADDNAADDLLNLDINDKDLEVKEENDFEKDFEDE